MENPPRPATLPPGYDEEDPYEDVDLSELPAWWRRNVEEFRAHGMRPYRPPRFEDGTLTPPLVERLASDLGVTVRFEVRDPQGGGQWTLVVDGEAVAPVDRYRDGGGYTVYELSPEAFETMVRDAASVA